MGPRGIRRAALALLCLLAGAARADSFSGRVTAILGGDTLTVTDAAGLQRRVRLAGIEAPAPGQPYADRAKTALGALAFGKEVRADCTAVPGEGGQRCRVFAGGDDIALRLVGDGMARRDRKSARQQTAAERSAYEQAEFQASIRRLGVWSVRPEPRR